MEIVAAVGEKVILHHRIKRIERWTMSITASHASTVKDASVYTLTLLLIIKRIRLRTPGRIEIAQVIAVIKIIKSLLEE